MRFVVLLALLSSTVLAEECPVPGEVDHWVIDYCLWINESDDLSQPGVQECYKAEKKQASGMSSCKAKQHFKRKICEVHAYYDDSFNIKSCLADVEFQGPTVSNGGYKKPAIKNYSN